MNDIIAIALISSSAPIIVFFINIMYNIWREPHLLNKERSKNLFECKRKAINEIMQSMIPIFIHCVEPKSPIEFLTSLNQLKANLQNTMFKNSVWLLPDAYEPINNFLKELIKSINLFYAELGCIATKDLTKLNDDEIEVFVTVYENLKDTLINELLDQRRLLFLNLMLSLSSTKIYSAKKIRKMLTEKIKRTSTSKPQKES